MGIGSVWKSIERWADEGAKKAEVDVLDERNAFTTVKNG